MRHLHVAFIGASLSLGLAVLLFGFGLWQLLLVGYHVEGLYLPIGFTTLISLLAGATLFVFATSGIQAELRRPKRRHAK